MFRLENPWRPRTWCKDQLWREERHARIEAFADIIPSANPTQSSFAGVQISVAELCE
jgi:hypothetical protein